MKISTAAPSAVGVLVAASILAGCGSGSQVAPGPAAPAAHRRGSLMQRWSRLASVIPPELRARRSSASLKQTLSRSGAGPGLDVSDESGKGKGKGGKGKGKSGFYASEFDGSAIFGYADPNSANHPPTCTVAPVSYLNDVDVDPTGNLIQPDGGTGAVVVYKGSRRCGPLLGSFVDPYGQPSDASSLDASTGTIAVGNIFDSSGGPGSISVCTLSAQVNCPTNLTNSAIYELFGVAMDGSGNCYASAYDGSGNPTLTYFAGCAGAGVAATGYQNAAPGGLEFDSAGNLLAIDSSGQLDIYTGCPNCELVGGPFPLHGPAVFGHLGPTSASGSGLQFATADYANGTVDVYNLGIHGSGYSLTYLYSFNNSLSVSDDVIGAAIMSPPTPPNPSEANGYPTTIINFWAYNPATTPTDIDLVFNGNVTTALNEALPLYGIWDAFCPSGNGPCTTGSTSIMYDPTSNKTTFTLSGTNGLSPNSYYTNQSHFGLLYGAASLASLPCPQPGSEWSFASIPDQPVAWDTIQYEGCIPPALSMKSPVRFHKGRASTNQWKYAVVYSESSFAPITSSSPATTGQWFMLAYHPNGRVQPKFTFANYGTKTIYTADSGIVLNLNLPTSPDCQQNQACPENLNLLTQLSYTGFPPPGFKGSKFKKMQYAPPKEIPPAYTSQR
jgi:hypothetical protein